MALKIFTAAGGSTDVLVFLAIGGVQQKDHEDVTFSVQPDVGYDFYGAFNKTTGVFEAKYPGAYRFHFYGAIHPEVSSKFQLLVNNVEKTGSPPPGRNATISRLWHTISVVKMLPLMKGDKVRVAMNKGSLFESSANRFCCCFVSSIA